MKTYVKSFNKLANINLIFAKKSKISFLKNFLILLFLNIFAITVILLGFFSYWNIDFEINDLDNINDAAIDIYKWANLNSMPLELRVLRTCFDLAICWYLLFSIIGIKKGYDYKKTDKILSSLFFFSWLFPISFFTFFYNLKYYNFIILRNDLIKFFGRDDLLKQEYSFKYWKRKLILITWIIFLPTPYWLVGVQPENNLNLDWTNNFLFYSACYFTIQTNFLCFLFLTIYLFFPTQNFFKNNNYLISCATYIFIVGSIWLLVLLPVLVVSNNVEYWSNEYFASTIWLHIVNPIVFTIFTIILILKTERKKEYYRSESILYVCIYPIMYTIFVAILPFNAGISIYGIATNLNPKLAIFLNLNSNELVYRFGGWWCMLNFIGMNALIIFISYTYFYLTYHYHMKNEELKRILGIN